MTCSGTARDTDTTGSGAFAACTTSAAVLAAAPANRPGTCQITDMNSIMHEAGSVALYSVLSVMMRKMGHAPERAMYTCCV